MLKGRAIVAMPSTSQKPYEYFLADTLRRWLRVQPSSGLEGHRYQFRSANSGNSKALVEALRKQCEGVVSDGQTRLPCFTEQGVRFIPVLCDGNVEGCYTENYVSRLRDQVASGSNQFERTALIVIHNSLLDTLINSAEDLGAPSSVWHPSSLKPELSKLLKSDKVSSLLLEQRIQQVVVDEDTCFGLRPIYNALEDGKLEFSEIGLLDDPLVLEMKGGDAQIKKRLQKNKELFDRLSFILETYPDQKEERLKAENFGAAFIKRHFQGDDWREKVGFAECIAEQEKNRSQKLELVEVKACSELKLIARGKNQKKAGQRDQSLLILQPREGLPGELSFRFTGDKITKTEVQVTSKNNFESTVEVKQKRQISEIDLKIPPVSRPTFFQLYIKRDKTSERHWFRALILPEELIHLDAVKNIFLVDALGERLLLLTDENSLRLNPSGENRVSISDSQEVIDCEAYDVVDFEEVSHQSDLVLFKVQRGELSLDIQVESEDTNEAIRLPFLFNVRADRIGTEFDVDAIIMPERGKIVVNNSEFGLRPDRLQILRHEYQLIEEETVAILPGLTVTIDALKNADHELGTAYEKLFDYYRVHSTLPSLVGWSTEHSALVSRLVRRFAAILESVANDRPLSDNQKIIVQTGFVKIDEREFVAPFSPLSLAYYLEFSRRATGDESFQDLPKVTASRLNPAGLIPYVYAPDFAEEYAHIVPLKEDPAWLEVIGKKNSGLNFIRPLVKDKITSFLKAYTGLFSGKVQSVLIINCVNLGEAEEFLLGVLDYFKTDLKNDEATGVSIHVNFYDKELIVNALDQFADSSSSEEIRANLGLEREKNADTLIHLLRTRLTYSKFRTDQEQQYSHLAFFCNITPVKFELCTLENSVSGILADGLLSGPAAERQDRSAYFTGFGARNLKLDSDLLKIGEGLNCLLRPARRPDTTQFFRGKGNRLSVSTKFREDLRATYESAIWTVLVDPKVNLDFFNSEEDLVLIHFSDQYTSSAEYDAITVTNEREIFAKQTTEKLSLSELNAFNGVWLLDMLKANEKTKKERVGVIAAYKFLYSLVARSDISWVPLSVAEMIRVTGNLGLRMKDSDFSRNVNGYKSGAISDDVLFVGFKDDEMLILPLEVKAGSVPDYLHASQQARELARYLGDEILGPQNLRGQLYRSLFIRQVFMQVEKYELYGVFTDEQLGHLKNRREYWLSGNFPVCRITSYAKGAVIALIDKDTAYQPRFKKEEDVLFAEIPFSLVSNFIAYDLKDKPEELAMICKPSEDYILRDQVLECRAYPDPSTGHEETENDVCPKPEMLSTRPAEVEQEDDEPVELPSAEPEKSISYTEKPKFAQGLHALLGHNVIGDRPLVWEPTNTSKFLNPNSGIIGTMGTGKTQFTKSLVTQLVRNRELNVGGKPTGILIFDYKSDYVDDEFLEATGGKKFMPHKLPYNPLSIHGTMPMLPVHTAGGFVETMARAYRLGAKQKLRLRDVILDAYESKGISRSDESTWSFPAPTIEKVWRMFDAEEKVEQDSLYAALRELSDYQIFEDQADKLLSLYDLVDGVTVIELAGFSPDLQNLIVGLTLDQFYAQMQKGGKPALEGDHRQLNKLILVDEADNFMSQDFPSLRKILKEGREYGVGVILSTQDIKHFKTSDNDYTAYILTWIVHRVAQIQRKEIKSIFNIDDKADQEQLMADIRQLEKHYSIYIDGEKNLVKMKDRAFWELMQQTARYSRSQLDVDPSF